LILDDSNDGTRANEGLGTIVVKVHRVKVLGQWEGKLTSSTPIQAKPILLGEKDTDASLAHRVGYVWYCAVYADCAAGIRRPPN